MAKPDVYTVQHTQFGVTDTDDYAAEAEARAVYEAACADPKTTEAWLFDGPGPDARALEYYRRPQREQRGDA